MTDPRVPQGASSAAATEDRPAETLEGLLDRLAERGAALGDVTQAASRHCRRARDCEGARVWIPRRGGRRLFSQDVADQGDEPKASYRLRRGEGLPGWTVVNGRMLRLAAGEVPEGLKGSVPAFRAALVLPLFRRGHAFAAIECLDPRGRPAFTDDDVARLEADGEAIAAALDHALLSEETGRRALEKEALFEITKALSAPLDLDEVIEAIFRSLRHVVRFDAAAIYLVNPQTLALEQVADEGYPEGANEAFGLRVGVGLVGWVAKTGDAVIVPDVRKDPRYVAARPQTRSELAAPLLVKGRTIGVFNLESDLEDAFHEGHLELVTAFASHAAVAVERARMTRALLEQRRLEKELAIAREIQLSFLPKSAPRIAGYELAGAARPHTQVGGDYYDFIRVSDARLGLAIADSSGKGIPAALLMAGFRMSLLAEIRNEFAIRAVMRKVNSLLHESIDRDKFVTAFYGVLDVKNRVLVFSNAGHNPPILLRADGTLEQLVEGGVALGVLPDAQYEERPLALAPGDTLLLYTDGVSEAESPTGEQYGQWRLEQLLVRLRGRAAQEILDGVVEDVLAWAGAHGQNDDLTLMVVKVLGEGS